METISSSSSTTNTTSHRGNMIPKISIATDIKEANHAINESAHVKMKITPIDVGDSAHFDIEYHSHSHSRSHSYSPHHHHHNKPQMSQVHTESTEKVAGIFHEMNETVPSISMTSKSTKSTKTNQGDQTQIVYTSEHEEEEEEEEEDIDPLNNMIIATDEDDTNKPKFSLQIKTKLEIKVKSSSDIEEDDDEGGGGGRPNRIRMNPTTPHSQSVSRQSESIELSSTLANEKSSLLTDRLKSSDSEHEGGHLDVDSLIQRLISNNSCYHKAPIYEQRNLRNAKEFHQHSISKASQPKTPISSIASLLNFTSAKQEEEEEEEEKSMEESLESDTSYSDAWDVSIDLAEDEILELCRRCRALFMRQPMLLELEGPLKVVGDIHGQYFDLLRIFEYIGFPSSSSASNYLFLGDYVDRGKLSIETIVLLFAYKFKYPLNFFLLRGNHEAQSVNRIYGFYDECKRRFSVKLWKCFCDVFNCLPISALIEEKIFCCHGGLSPQLKATEMINSIERPTEIPESGLLCDLLWSDPADGIKGWENNGRGVSYTFGKDVVHRFLKKHDLDLIARAHQVVEDGYEFFAKRGLVTIFSAPNYCGEFDNCAGIMSVDQTLMCSFQVLQPYK